MFLMIHHNVRIIAGDAQRRREQAVLGKEYKEAHGKDGDVFNVQSKLSKQKIKEQVQIDKLFEGTESTKPIQGILSQSKISPELAQTSVTG
ncbi:MAG: hypothetical protein EZS28_012895 [Streblomastix strix]|uniref:Uncharacterized protein n=1 Tax=Streblomastix strix TaxID=222440 RepID=A0A5J4W9G2_9EUKA|nr:MAG: hypothetical protein EZS28_012895 [Streblomastix strix]